MAFLKNLLPWHVRRALAAARRFHAHRKPPFEGVYARFEDVRGGEGWSTPDWVAAGRDAARVARARLGAALPDPEDPARALLPALLAGLSAGPFADRQAPLRILDFGGAAGVDYAWLRASFANASGLRYHIVDSGEAIAAGRELWKEDPAVSFASALPGPEERFDVVHAFSSIFYVEDFAALLARFAGYSPAVMLFARTPVRAGEPFVRAQTNAPGAARVPHWVLGLEALENALRPHGYFLAWRALDHVSSNVDAYDPAHRVERASHLIFTRGRAP